MTGDRDSTHVDTVSESRATGIVNMMDRARAGTSR